MAAAGSPCLGGFALQGVLSANRRNYSVIWSELETALASHDSLLATDDRFALQLFGSGFASSIGIPSALRPKVSVFKGLRYLDYYNAIHHTLALIPAFASDAYYDRKFSSTVITSLITGTPVIADAQMLRSYSFLTKDAVFLRHDGESDVSVMERVLGMPLEEVFAKRRALTRLTAQLNVDAGVRLAGWARVALQARLAQG
ncbi:hypothetical protein FOA52_008396 [Chlamydomonas sp. UWO 241]|nr:hypothetical protein FOA52_008396 [Chlamydomonas sp. UWO 241]